jgi:hypothetical protein
MKKIYSLLSFSCFVIIAGSTASFGQNYCNVTTATPYTADMPGITNFQLGSINRTSLNVENYPNNSYVMTAATTNLSQGQSYPVSIHHSEDNVSFNGAFTGVRNNLRVWIDFNHNGVLDDAGETVISSDLQTPGTTFTGNITIPVGAMLGATRMRVTAKMSADGGHTLPTPCDNPADPGGYHGEIEDYTVTIVTPNGVANSASITTPLLEVYPNPFQGQSSISYSLGQKSNVSLEIYNLLGEKQLTILDNEIQAAGLHKYDFSLATTGKASGIYFIRLISGSSVVTKQVIMTE